MVSSRRAGEDHRTKQQNKLMAFHLRRGSTPPLVGGNNRYGSVPGQLKNDATCHPIVGAKIKFTFRFRTMVILRYKPCSKNSVNFYYGSVVRIVCTGETLTRL